MSNLIRSRSYAPREASLLQQRPAALIDAAEAGWAGAGRAVELTLGAATLLHTRAVPVVTLVTYHGTGATRYALCDTYGSTAAAAAIAAQPDTLRASFEQWSGHAREALERAATPRRSTGTATAELRVKRLAAIQAALGFTTQDLAAVLGLSRPQVYRWLDATDDVRLQDAKRQRLAAVERMARAWQERSPAPLRSVAHEPLSGGQSLFGLLSAPAIDEPAVRAGFDELEARLNAQPRTLSQRMADAGFKRRPSARSLPSDE